MDFFKVKERYPRKDVVEIYPDFIVGNSKDLMIRGGDFYAIWDENAGLWNTDIITVQKIVDEELYKYAEDNKHRLSGFRIDIKTMSSFASKSWKTFKDYIKNLSDHYKQLDCSIIFSNTAVTKESYISKKLDYPLEKGSIKAYEKIISTLYSPEERQKIEWAIGAIISGEAKKIQKFLVFYGDRGTGKSTILHIVEQLFNGYYIMFEAKDLVSNREFTLDQFRSNPLVAIQHDGDLSKIEDNAKLNSLVSHEEMLVKEKFKSPYVMKFCSFLMMASNRPVKITDAKSGLLRRLIDVHPTGNKLEESEYDELIEKIPFELSGIAYHCLQVFKELGASYYSRYIPMDMVFKTDPFFNFVEAYRYEFEREDGVSLKQAYSMYKQYCDETNAPFKLQMYMFREELKNYFDNFDDVKRLEGAQIRSYYSGFNSKKMDRVSGTKTIKVKAEKKEEGWISFKESKTSVFDEQFAKQPAQYATEDGKPAKYWENVKTTLSDLDPCKLHYSKMPEQFICIDFDLKDKDGNKSLELNLEAANKFPQTYAETSQSGNGIHLIYEWTGDISKLSHIFDENIEIKTFVGNASLRRKLVKCNDIPIAKLGSGLPLKKTKGNKMVDFEAIKSEKVLRTMIRKNLNKEYMGATKPSIDFISKLLDDAYETGMHYDVTDMRQAVLIFAINSTNQSDYCIKAVNKMHFKSDDPTPGKDPRSKEPIIFFDCEVFPNLLLINWKKQGRNNPVVRMINPKPSEVEELMSHKLVGYNCRRYDNHILWGRMMGYTNEQIYNLSQKLVTTKKGEHSSAFFNEAYNVSYTDIYDYCTKKQSLKKWEIELGIHHLELGLPWDKPVPEKLWGKVAEYCDNDVISTEAVWDATQNDFKAREILVAMCKHAGIDACVNDTTNTLTTKIICGNNRHPELVYTDLSEEFPGYTFIPKDRDHEAANMYRGIDLGFGGYNYSNPGMYKNVALLDIASMHPHSAIALNYFGIYTSKFEEIVDARIAIKHKEWNKVRTMLDGALAQFVTDDDISDPKKEKELAKKLSNALKIPINSVYGLTSAKFMNAFKDDRNENNIVALRGALFMKTLQDEVEKKGYTVVHIKTDSIKIADADEKIIKFCMDFAKKYKYEFEHEATYERMCIVNLSTYIAKYADGPHEFELSTGEKIMTEWTATAAQFQQPYVFKTLFAKQPIKFKDMCETKEVKGSLYLDMNEGLPDVTIAEQVKLARETGKVSTKKLEAMVNNWADVSDEELDKTIASGHNYKFVGRIGEFCPMLPGYGAGELLRFADDKYSAAVGTKGYRWLESEIVKEQRLEKFIDRSYYNSLVDDAIEAINKYCDFHEFVADDISAVA